MDRNMPKHGLIGGGMNGIESKLEEFIDELETGETARINHIVCPAGTDTRRRLYITKKPDVILGYCHNCGESSSKYISPRDRYRDNRGQPFNTTTKPSEYVEPLVVKFNEELSIPIEAEAWRIKNKLSRKQCSNYKIYYEPEHNAIYLPFFTTETFTNGYQLRPLYRYGAKYINYVKDNDKELGGIVREPTLASDTLVIVEDLISGIHINEAGYDALVNYGTHVKPTILYRAIKGKYKHYVVWLDNDNKVVKEKARQMYDILHMYKNMDQSIRLVRVISDPKHHSDDDIRKEVENGLT